MNTAQAHEWLATGSHERCGSPFCRKKFPFTEGKFQRLKALDQRWYCDGKCASAQYLVEEEPVTA